MLRSRLVPLCIAGWLSAAGCGGPAQLRYEESLERTPAPAAHAVHERRLLPLMRELDRLRTERLPKALDVASEEERQADEIARVARAMADSAARIPEAIPSHLDDRQRTEFLELAARLGRQTARLADEAERLTPDERRRTLAEMDSTCDSCHTRFGIEGLDVRRGQHDTR